ncbi:MULTISPECIES: hypothetical protein [unclassified Roseateles]|uniref:hypothetical protein n=1 Tax=unclassified Roseateles TaxID=2626991 RepID=UPI000A9439DA|nr:MULTISPECIES: hypothetical protein [unclassified Roseateles]
MSNPLSQVGQTPHPEASAKPDQPPSEAGNPALQHPQTTAENSAPAPTAQQPAANPAPPKKAEIADLKPGEPPPESSAGS